MRTDQEIKTHSLPHWLVKAESIWWSSLTAVSDKYPTKKLQASNIIC